MPLAYTRASTVSPDAFDRHCAMPLISTLSTGVNNSARLDAVSAMQAW